MGTVAKLNGWEMMSAKSAVPIAVAIVLGGALIAGAIVATRTDLFRPGQRQADPYGALKTAVARQLVDPHGADFRDLRRTESGYCGEVNGKNQAGGYAGFQRFFAIQDPEGSWRVTFDAPLIDVMCKATG